MKRRGLVFNPAMLKKMGAIGKDNSTHSKDTSKENSPLIEILSRKRRIKENGMNKTEREFSEILDNALSLGEIIRWQFEEVSLKIAPSTRYIPDFLAVLPTGAWQVFEIKGHLEDDAAVKFKAAAEKYPEISFHMLKKQKGQWVTVYNLPSRLKPMHTGIASSLNTKLSKPLKLKTSQRIISNPKLRSKRLTNLTSISKKKKTK